MEKQNPIFMTKDDDSVRIVKRRDGTSLITAISVSGAKKNWIYPKRFNVDKFIQLMKKNGFIIDGEKRETPRLA